MLVDKYPWLLEPSFLTFTIRSILAALCAGIIGFDRHSRGSAAGMRTHILVCLGAMIAMTTGIFVSMYYNADAERVGAQVVSGMGFLGAGTIIVHRGHISGLTTAAGLWASACIGLAIGTGFYEGAVIGTIAVFVVESGMRSISKEMMKKHMRVDGLLSNSTDETEEINASER